MRVRQAAEFTEPEIFYQMSIDPVRVAILTSVAGLQFSQAWERRIMVEFGFPRSPARAQAPSEA